MPFIEHIGVESITSKQNFRGSSTSNQLWSSGAWQNEKELQKSEHIKWIKKYFPPPPGVMLEAGCGLGQWVRFFKDMGYDTYGIDYSHYAIEKAIEQWPDLKLFQSDIRNTSFKENFFDGLISLGAIEHDVDGPKAALIEMLRILSPGGILYCTVPCMNYVRRAGLIHICEWLKCNIALRKLRRRCLKLTFFEYVFSPMEYEKILRESGFEVLKIIPLDISNRFRGKPGSIRYSASGIIRKYFLKIIHSKYPFLMNHMMAGICRKPSVIRSDSAID